MIRAFAREIDLPYLSDQRNFQGMEIDDYIKKLELLYI